MFLLMLLLFPQWEMSGNYHPADKLVFTCETDRGVEANIFLTYHDNGSPDYYYCELETPICLEKLCNPVEIRLEWDLLGSFKTYTEARQKELTKFDHEPFGEKDHEQLKKILGDRESFLQDYQMEDLVDTTVKVYSKEIDGLTAATSATFAEKLIPGAIYTCYTLWHIVNGEISDRILAHTRTILNEKLKREMLLSGFVGYQDFILDGMNKENKELFLPELLQLITGKNQFIAIKSIRNLPDAARSGDNAQILMSSFDIVKLPVQNAILQFFLKQNCSVAVLKSWVSRTPTIPGSLKLNLYQMFENNLSVLDSESVRELLRILEEKQGNADGYDKKMITLLSNR